MTLTVFALTGDDVVRHRLDWPPGTEPVLAGDPDTVLAGAGARCIAVDPGDPARVYVGTFDDGLYVSRDAGETWSRPADCPGEPRVLSVAASRSHQQRGVSVVYAGTEPSNLYRSEDGGEHWQVLPRLRELPSEPDWSFPPRPWTHHVRTIALHPTDPDWLAVGIELGGVMRSFDGGSSWIDHNPQAYSDAHQLLMHPLAPERLYEAAGQGVARSDDRGDTWRKFEHGLDRHYAWAQAVDPADPELWYVAVSRSPFTAHGDRDGQAHLWRSRGDGWSAIDEWGSTPELRRMPYVLATLPGQPDRLIVGLRGGTLMLTDDAGESWTCHSLAVPDLIDLAVAPA
jgi:photosystem II stability/assembly factor-like uncharacterized protein